MSIIISTALFQNCKWELKEEDIPVEEEGPPPPPPKRGESLRKTPTRPLPAIPNSESLDHFQPSPYPNKPDLVTNGFKARAEDGPPVSASLPEEKLPLVPPNKDLPEAPPSESEDESET